MLSVFLQDFTVIWNKFSKKKFAVYKRETNATVKVSVATSAYPAKSKGSTTKL